MSIAILGEALIDFIPAEDGSYRPHLGGSPYNVAIGLARQHIDVAYLSPLSEDALGSRLARALCAEGVSLPGARRSALPTSLALVDIDTDGLPSYTLYREGIADTDSSFETICADLPGDIDLLHTGSLAITPDQLPKIRTLFQYLRKSGILISVDINIRLGSSTDTQAYLDGVMSLFQYCDIIKTSEEDIIALKIHADAMIAAQKIYDMTTDDALLVLTAGAGGAHLIAPGGITSKKAYPVAEPVDTIGAGDVFHAAFLAILIRSGLLGACCVRPEPNTLAEALDYACAAAAINVSRAGCAPPTHKEVIHFIKGILNKSA